MKLLYCSTFMFRKESGDTYALPSCSDPFFQKYLDVFEEVRVIGSPVRDYLDTDLLVKMTDSRISVRITKNNTTPQDFKNDSEIKRVLSEEISKSEAVLIKPSSRKGMMAISIAKALHKPYMIEITGDIHNALKQHPSLLKRLYAPFFYWQIKRTIKDCLFGLYVSKDYLQGQFPIHGQMCGCADVILEKSDDEILKHRYERIDAMDINKRVDISLIGFYQGKMKGIDTAIRALSQLPASYHLNILGNGTEANRKKWYEYGNKFGIEDSRIHFPNPLPDSHTVLKWLDTQDFFILPTRSEGFGRCCAEAMSRGCICFATDICTMPELHDKSCLHRLDDDKKLADLIRIYSNNKVLMKSNAKRNFEKAKEYDFDVLKIRRNKFLEKFKEYCSNF